MWDIVKDLLSVIGELLGLIVVAILVGVIWLLATVFDWFTGLGSKKKRSE